MVFIKPHHSTVSTANSIKANLPNLRRLFVEARTEIEESAYSRNAVGMKADLAETKPDFSQFYNLVLFMSSVAVFSLVAQRIGAKKPALAL
jgi:hypothetical protein